MPAGARGGGAVSLAVWLTERLRAPTGAVAPACRASGPTPKASPESGGQAATGRDRDPRGKPPAAPRPLPAVAAPEAKAPAAPPSDPDPALRAIAHDIRNPLTTIRVFVDLLPQRMNRPEFMERFQRVVPREIQRIEELAGSLRRLGKGMESGLAGPSARSPGPNGSALARAEGRHPHVIHEAQANGEAL